MDLNQVAAKLYAGAREEFVSSRTELAKQARSAGNRDLATQITELRKPTVGAWVVNRLADDPDGNLAGLLDVGARLRAAQFELDTAAMRTLGTERRRAVATLVRRARKIAEDAGIAAGAGLSRDVEETLTAAVADEAAGLAVASGRLTRTLQYSGFGEVDLEAATATTTAEPKQPDEEPRQTDAEPKQTDEAPEQTDEAQRKLLRQAVFAATERYGRAELEQATADALVRTTEAGLEHLQDELSTLIERIEQARAAAQEANTRARNASTELDDAREQLTRARQAADPGA